jgi:DNA/RNA-binding domain of Phe-tRNA-synthetase-like protein
MIVLLRVSDTWRNTFPGAHVGTLALRDVSNPPQHPALEHNKRLLENELRTRFAGRAKADLAALPTMRAYAAYYRSFRKTYHVLLQLRAVALEGKPLPSVAALVEAMYMAELSSGLLTAGHDLDLIQMPLTLGVSIGGERTTALSGHVQELKPGDMILSDAAGVICSVIYGLDSRSAIRPETRRVLFVVYAPDGIRAEQVHQHLETMRDNVQLFAPDARAEELHVYSAQPHPS